MPLWMRIDVHYFNHPKVIQLPPLAQLLYLRACAYSKLHLTDGSLSTPALRSIAYDLAESTKASDLPVTIDNWVSEMVRVGLFERTDSGITIHDFLEWNQSKQDVEFIKQLRSDAGRKGGRPKANEKQNESKTKANEKQKLTHSTEYRVQSTEKEEEYGPQPRYSVEQIREKWNAITGVKVCKRIEGALLQKIKKLSHDHPSTWWDELFAEIVKSSFLSGKVAAHDGKKPFRIDLDWATGPINLGKILSGKYDDSGSSGKPEKLKVAL